MLIKEMCMLAHADDELSDSETLLIGKVGEAMGVSLEKIQQISNWVIDRIIWLERGKLIFGIMAELSDNGGESRIRKMEMLRNDSSRLDTPENIVRKAVERLYPRINAEDSRRIVTGLVTQPTSSKIKIGDEEIRIDYLNEYVADNIELINAGSSEYGSSSMGEYFGWIEEGQSVIRNMTDGEITVQDLEEKHDLLSNFQQREVDLMTCIALYKRCNLEDERIKKKFEELNKKLLRLREIRSAVETSTKDKVDEKNRPENNVARDIIKAQVYLNFLSLVGREVEDGKQLVSPEERRQLNIISNSYVNVPYVLESISRASQRKDNFRESLAERYVMQKEEAKPQTRESIEHKLAVLSGRRAPLRQEPEYDYSQTRARAFDMNKYLMLKKLKESQDYLRA